MLRKLNRWCKPGGRVLLMEHGISSNRLFALAQKTLNPLAYRFIGCHQTRDIMGMIQASPLRIETEEHFMSGMMHLVRCSPSHG